MLPKMECFRTSFDCRIRNSAPRIASSISSFHIFGQHPTRLWPEDFERIHKLWLEISEKEPGAEIRHRDVVSVALYRLDKEFHSGQGSEMFNEIRREALEQKHGVQSDSEPSED